MKRLKHAHIESSKQGEHGIGWVQKDYMDIAYQANGY